LITEPYPFPDLALTKPGKAVFESMIWQPNTVAAVLGRGDKAKDLLNIEQINRHNIPVYQRRSGGHAVILTPKMAVLSICLRGNVAIASKDFFAACNSVIVAALIEAGMSDVSTRGISDVTIGDKKIAGTSIYRNKHLIFYHAIINLGEDPGFIATFLQHPPREPAYREKRSHDQFITSIWNNGFLISFSEFKRLLQKETKIIENKIVKSD
jgi:lipoate-protein ligase A